MKNEQQTPYSRERKGGQRALRDELSRPSTTDRVDGLRAADLGSNLETTEERRCFFFPGLYRKFWKNEKKNAEQGKKMGGKKWKPVELSGDGTNSCVSLEASQERLNN